MYFKFMHSRIFCQQVTNEILLPKAKFPFGSRAEKVWEPLLQVVLIRFYLLLTGLVFFCFIFMYEAVH